MIGRKRISEDDRKKIASSHLSINGLAIKYKTSWRVAKRWKGASSVEDKKPNLLARKCKPLQSMTPDVAIKIVLLRMLLLLSIDDLLDLSRYLFDQDITRSSIQRLLERASVNNLDWFLQKQYEKETTMRNINKLEKGNVIIFTLERFMTGNNTLILAVDVPSKNFSFKVYAPDRKYRVVYTHSRKEVLSSLVGVLKTTIKKKNTITPEAFQFPVRDTRVCFTDIFQFVVDSLHLAYPTSNNYNPSAIKKLRDLEDNFQEWQNLHGFVDWHLFFSEVQGYLAKKSDTR